MKIFGVSIRLFLSATAISFLFSCAVEQPVITTWTEIRNVVFTQTNWEALSSFSRTNAWNTAVSNYVLSNLVWTRIDSLVSNRFTNQVYADTRTASETNHTLLQTATNLASVDLLVASNWNAWSQNVETTPTWFFAISFSVTNGALVSSYAVSNLVVTNFGFTISNLATNFAAAYSLTNAVTNALIRDTRTNAPSVYLIANTNMSAATNAGTPSWLTASNWNVTNGLVVSNFALSNLVATNAVTTVSNFYQSNILVNSATNVGAYAAVSFSQTVFLSAFVISNTAVFVSTNAGAALWLALSNYNLTNGIIVSNFVLSNLVATNAVTTVSNRFASNVFVSGATNVATFAVLSFPQTVFLSAFVISNTTVFVDTNFGAASWLALSNWNLTNGIIVSNFALSNLVATNTVTTVSNHFASNVLVSGATNVAAFPALSFPQTAFLGSWTVSNWHVELATNAGPVTWRFESNWNLTNGVTVSNFSLSNLVSLSFVHAVSNYFESNVLLVTSTNDGTNVSVLDQKLLNPAVFLISNLAVFWNTNAGTPLWLEISNWNFTNAMLVSNFSFSNLVSTDTFTTVSNFYQSNVLQSSLTNDAVFESLHDTALAFLSRFFISNCTVTNWTEGVSTNWTLIAAWANTNGVWVSNWVASNLLWSGVSRVVTDYYASNLWVNASDGATVFSNELAALTNLAGWFRLTNWTLGGWTNQSDLGWKSISNWDVTNGFSVGMYYWSNMVYTNYVMLVSNLYTNEAFAYSLSNGFVEEMVFLRQTNLPSGIASPTITLAPLPPFTNQAAFSVTAGFSGATAPEIVYKRYSVNDGPVQTFSGGAVSLSGLTNGGCTVAIWAQDTNLVSSVTQTVTTFVDTAAPELTLSFTNGFITNAATLDVSGLTNDSAPSSGYAGLVVKLNGAPLTPQAAADGFSAPATAFTANSTNTLLAYLFDAAGNTNALTNSVVVDTVAPAFTTNNFPPWTNVSNFAVAISPSDNFSGVKSATFKAGGSVKGYTNGICYVSGFAGTNMPQTFTLSLADNAGNSSLTNTFIILYDTYKPILTFWPPDGYKTKLDTYPVSSYCSNNTITGYASPVRSNTLSVNGVVMSVESNWSNAVQPLAANSTNVFIHYTEDEAGNVIARTNKIIQDKTPPFCQVTNLSGGFPDTTNIVLSFTNFDALSGVSLLRISTNGTTYSVSNVPGFTNVSITVTPDITNIRVWANDGAGNTSSVSTFVRLPPTVTIDLINGQNISSNAAITGTSAYPDSVASVWMSVNGSAFALVSGTTNWSTNNNPDFWTNLLWTNTISVYAVDIMGRISLTNTVTGITVDYYSKGLAFNLINAGTEYEVLAGTATNGAVVVPGWWGGLTVTGIASTAFKNLLYLSKISFPFTITNVGNSAFQSCGGLTELALPNGITNIGNDAFSGCTNITNFTVPTGIKNIGDNTFRDCAKILNITLPIGITNIGNFAFYKCTSLTNIYFPNGIVNIGTSAFVLCNSLTNLLLPDSLTYLGYGAFNGCSGLTNISLPTNLRIIGISAFGTCNGISSLSIPFGVTNIGNGAFLACSKLTNITVDSFNSYYSSLNGVLFNKTMTALLFFPNGINGVYNIPSTVTIISDSAFNSCKGLTNISFPSGLTNIGYNAFANCISLTNVQLPNLISNIASGMFAGCLNIKQIILPANISNIGNSAFSGCSGLKNINLPSRLTNIEPYAFASCTNLNDILIPIGVRTFGSSAFMGCTSLTNVTIMATQPPNADGSQFNYCNILSSIRVPSSSINTYKTWGGWNSYSGIIFSQ